MAAPGEPLIKTPFHANEIFVICDFIPTDYSILNRFAHIC